MIGLYALRVIAGLAFGVVVPLCLIFGQHVACDAEEKAWIFTGLTTSLFLGDFAGPLLAEASAQISPRLPLLSLGIVISLMMLPLAMACSKDLYCKAPQDNLTGRPNSRLMVVLLLCLTIIGTGGLAAVHLSLVLHRPATLFNREHVAWMLSLCGLAMLGAQLFHAKFTWLVDRPVKLTALMLVMQGVALWNFSVARSGPGIAASIFIAGWSAATLRLIASFWISTSRIGSGVRLGIQQGVASVSQVGVPVAIALLREEWHLGVLWAVIALCIIVLVALPLVWRELT